MPNPKQPKKKIVKSERHWCSKDCKECGDSLRKQEEGCEHKNISPNVIGLADEVCNDCGSKKYMRNRVPTPKVATSEKGKCNHNNPDELGNCYDCGIDQFIDTPHESEDWEAEFEKNFTRLGDDWDTIIRFCRLDLPEGDSRSIKSFIKQVESKAYQRGREEGYKDGFNDAKPNHEAMAKDLELARQSILSLAVQEIEKFRFSVPIGEGKFTTLCCPDCKEQRYVCKQCLVEHLKARFR